MWTFITCCCEHGDEYAENPNLDSSIISFNYIKYHTEYLNEFRHYRNQAEERAFQQNMVIVRRKTADEILKQRSLRPE